MATDANLIPAAGAGGKTNIINRELSAALARVHRRLRPWHIYSLLGACVLVTILSVVLVHVRDHQRNDALIQSQVNVGSYYSQTMLPLDESWPLGTPSDQSTARVNLGYAQYQGHLLGSGIAQYLGMRYAQKPTGDLRWRAPIEPEQIRGDQEARHFGKVCLGISTILPSSTQGEDCLFANVWAPANATADSKLPVLLFIQGGGYTTNSNANWNGTYLVEASGRNMVFVNFNYRVGLYGFLAGERVRADGDLNVGLLDQRMMMQWIQQHISEFGGDPDHVVIQGVSAGAGSVAHHLTAYGGESQTMFHAAIAESLFLPTQPRVSELEWQMDKLLSQTGCDNNESPMSCLRGKDLHTLQAFNVPSPFPGRSYMPLPLFYWGPCIDGNFSRDYLYTMFDQGNFINVPILMGTDNDEGSYFGVNASTSDEVTIFLQNNYPHLSSSTAANITQSYPLEDSLPYHAAWFPSASRAYGEATFICPTVHVLDAFQSKLNSTSSSSVSPRPWAYRYDVLAPENAALGVGVPHTWETWAVFGPDSINGIGGGPPSYYGVAASIVPVVTNYWISFVLYYDPNVRAYASAPEWEAWDGDGQRLKFETGSVEMETTPSDLRSRCDMWKALAAITEQ
ncbi:hypothetical protein PFICI_01824 [Pestalotiopsis fici W106-1]|uniref:Carboxylic ester hydrolase n=1 Tax=Pestalotiopsis fici (strain W106-1 / CGMCC3.15140) TaxID=1229662 RepID=W3XRX0_PESFW|nr:uncharacterized protein PFICI_01824 [Pestalotiopsis fici W106-1]ETS87996.1 hypothetical protein PFICI_01824 [Pestalotiopsis fici W106-1]